MDDELLQLEAELQALRPMPPSPTLAARVNRELSAPTSRPSRLWWLYAAALPTAAAATFLAVMATRRPAIPSEATLAVAPPVAEFKPVSAENVLYAVRDEGVVTLADGTAARRERLQYVDTITWRNPRTNASVQWTVPREEVRVVPVRFQ